MYVLALATPETDNYPAMFFALFCSDDYDKIHEKKELIRSAMLDIKNKKYSKKRKLSMLHSSLSENVPGWDNSHIKEYFSSEEVTLSVIDSRWLE